MRHPKLLTTVKTYTRKEFLADLMAGFTVSMVALPLSLAIAIASGASPEKGLITAIVGGFFISLLGGSRVQIGGPTGAFIVVVFGVIAQHGYDGLVLATFMAGLMLMVAGYFRVGRYISLVPEAVINGFTIGIAIVIAASQIKDFFGLSLSDVPADFIEKSAALWSVRNSANPTAFLIALTTLGTILFLKRFAPRFPGLIAAIAGTSALVWFLDLPVDTIHSRFGALPRHLPMPSFPDLSPARIVEIFPSALAIAFLAGIESLLSAMVADRLIKSQHRPNAELLAQGVANFAAALFGGLPATGAIARTATNIRAGGKTPMAGIFHSTIILVAMLLLATQAGYLAMPALAALLILTAWNMSEPASWKSQILTKPIDGFLMVVTLLLTVFVDLMTAIGVGVALSLVLRYRERILTE